MSASIRQDSVWIPDVSLLWSKESDLFSIVSEYLERISTSRELTAEDRKNIGNRIARVQSLNNFRITALVLSAETSEEEIAEVFVRINSMGKALNQADFILTLMAVFWDEGRADLEQFCRDAREPVKGQPSPSNHFIDPDPDQLLRASVGLAFRRARLQFVYSILQGKDLETNEYSDETRGRQFDRLRYSQGLVLDLQLWHDFLKCIHEAGFRRSIRSGLTLMYCYVLYLIGRTELKVPEATLRRTIAQWFFMATITGRYTSNGETAMEADLAQLRNVNDAESFIGVLRKLLGDTLTGDFWDITLPNDLAVSSTLSPSLAIYEAAQVILDAPALFSTATIGQLLDPSLTAPRADVERHHLWPRAYLSEKGISQVPRVNQIANLAYVEWHDNLKAGAKSPAEYLPVLTEPFPQSAVDSMYETHGLFTGWETMEYDEFLQQRRERMAAIIRRAYERLSGGGAAAEPGPIDLTAIIEGGESDAVEFKSTLRMNLHTGKPDGRIEHAALKTVAGFLNTAGGTLIVGVTDDGEPVGIEEDQFKNEDHMSLHLTSLVKDRLGATAATLVHHQFEEYEDHRVMRVTCERSPVAVYLDGPDGEFFVRATAATLQLTGSALVDYVAMHF
ncbi:MAG: hypothetical protein F4152_03400 [Dehalococcoidia bacterium]|nr:hypothetical protein [Dehalococcoidia bacterium]